MFLQAISDLFHQVLESPILKDFLFVQILVHSTDFRVTFESLAQIFTAFSQEILVETTFIVNFEGF